MDGVAAYGCVNGTLFVFRSAYNYRLVNAMRGMLLYLLRQTAVGLVVFRYQKQTARVLIYTVDYSRTKNSAYACRPRFPRRDGLPFPWAC